MTVQETNLIRSDAMGLRLEADRTGDAGIYRRAAELYRAIGFETSAAACDRRAEHYAAHRDIDLRSPYPD